MESILSFGRVGGAYEMLISLVGDAKVPTIPDTLIFISVHLFEMGEQIYFPGSIFLIPYEYTVERFESVGGLDWFDLFQDEKGKPA